ncbi:hypothetical protein [Natrialba sp. SSL1]|uniref:hypothetical protein n=1 Tax=Natrialba sp. SSL1 TaxID=1869245 RepID=UPI0008F868CD|nr:hypothetical protein [Natrialba sp. SSL1]OIB55291.1 hypothetical protein BBD46_05370 [Natrialba sp. SSL1]
MSDMPVERLVRVVDYQSDNDYQPETPASNTLHRLHEMSVYYHRMQRRRFTRRLRRDTSRRSTGD